MKITFLIVGTLVGGIAKLLAHYLAGAIFWREYLDSVLGSPDLYSLLYNSGYMIPNIVINGVLLIVMGLKAPMLLNPKEENN